MLQPRDKLFFETFGYLHLPGALAQDVSWIIEDFLAAWKARTDIVHDGSKRTMFPVSMITTSKRLTALLDHPVINDVGDQLLGEGWSFNGGDGNFYSGDTNWHFDTPPDCLRDQTVTRHLKIAFYLDPLTRDTGALRVIPGSHHHGDHYSEMLLTQLRTMGVPEPEIPSVALETKPGDLAIFDHRLWHASFGGAKHRRMFTMNLVAPMHDRKQREAELTVMRWYRDKLGANWSSRANWLDWHDSMRPGERRRLDAIIELAAEMEKDTVASAS
jgi:hypothetical protein